jgi:hypothetical protein
MMQTQTCPECGAIWEVGKTCEDVFNECLVLEFNDRVAGSVHHLTVACYMIQHNGYSDEGLAWIRKRLEEFLEGGLTPQMVRQEHRNNVASGSRDWKVTGRPSQPLHPNWPLHITDLSWSTREDYCLKITQWAWSVLDTLKQIG